MKFAFIVGSSTFEVSYEATDIIYYRCSWELWSIGGPVAHCSRWPDYHSLTVHRPCLSQWLSPVFTGSDWAGQVRQTRISHRFWPGHSDLVLQRYVGVCLFDIFFKTSLICLTTFSLPPPQVTRWLENGIGRIWVWTCRTISAAFIEEVRAIIIYYVCGLISFTCTPLWFPLLPVL